MDIENSAPAEAQAPAAEAIAPEVAPAPSNDAPSDPPRQKSPKDNRTLEHVVDDAFATVEAEEAEAARQAAKQLEPAADDAERPKKEPAPKAKAAEKPDKETDKIEADESAERDENGRFKSKNAAPEVDKEADTQPAAELEPDPDAGDPPARFSKAAKEKWAHTSKEIRDEINRAIGEMEGGIEHHKQLSAEIDGIVDQQHLDVIHQSGQRAGDVVNKALAWEKMLGTDFPRGFEVLAKYFNVSLHDVAAQIVGQAPNADLAKMEQRSAQLESENAQLKQSLAAFERHYRAQEDAQAHTEIEQFVKENPGAEEMLEYMGKAMRNGWATDLTVAYRVARNMYGEPAAAQTPALAPPASSQEAAPAPEPPKRDLVAQTQKARLSISGAPRAGSNPSSKRPPPSISDAFDHAFDSVGYPQR